ncbi:calcium-binding protein [Actinoplanes derwentensis]|uniref:Hemolysin-type calcium-binding repeat-containing protein n=1 Tax=Actinoplanes derwentensis TaxID=113562 RepID=A0A1H2CXG9_9ACTN|nr:calcium-binding protein [Actinoplanes derwentensis]GID82846.1 hypothetical protein Ade03nite_17700 [Actinoplanes derwentensis]SDT75208.1 Hemolysin-type calcium-binding repeat-containing protein [Actinoplanes derwentensis]
MTSRTWLTRVGVTLLGTTTAVGMFAAPAQAASDATVSVLGESLIFKAAKGKVNRVSISQSGGKVVFDDRVAVKAGAGCAPVKGDKTKVTCTGVAQLHINLGDRDDVFVNRTALTSNVAGVNGNDTLTGGPGRDYLSGGAGNDKLYGGAGGDTLTGDSGKDVLYGNADSDMLYDGAGVDRVYGGAGDDFLWDGLGKDVIHGGAGNDRFLAGRYVYADRYYGGAGIDTVDYGQRKKAVTADADGKADDGQAGEKDTIATDIENLYGGSGNDKLTGTKGANVLQGGPGNDKLYGLAGNDTLYGEGGNDSLIGGAGNDRLVGDPGVNHDTETLFADVLLGGSGVDTAYYGSYHEPVTVDLDGSKGDDGVKGEHDTVGADVENVVGGYGRDTITGNAANNVLNGGGEGADILRGLGGDDTLLSDNQAAGISDEEVDVLDGGAHVKGDKCGFDAEDSVTNCEITL